MQIHIVQKGDTLWKISRSYGVSFDELKKLNAHLANPEYIVPGMKIFIPETKHTESMTHPYSEDRPVKKQMSKKEEVITHPVHKIEPAKKQPAKTHPPTHPPKKEQLKPKPVPQVPPAQPIPPYSMPFHIMPVPDLDMTPSPQGWRLIESTSIHINIHNDDCEREPEHPKPVVPPKTEVKPIPKPPVQHIPEDDCSPTEDTSTEFEQMYPCEQFQPMDLCQCSHPQMYPHMHPHMHPHMQPWGGQPCIPVCYIPVFPCPPFPCPPSPYQNY